MSAQNGAPPPGEFDRFPPAPPAQSDGFEHWLTFRYERRVLVVVRTVTTLNRLVDVLTLLENDHRVQIVFTVDERRPAILGAGASALLERLGMTVIPWQQALTWRFDLILAASENDDLHLLDGPVVLLPHGVTFQKYYPGTKTVAGLDPDQLIHDGHVVPALIAVSHQDQVERVRTVSQAAAERARIVGDPCLDRILASRHRRPDYRAALDARGRQVVTLASTWGPASLLGAHPTLPLRLISELPIDEYVVCLVTHPGIAAAHGAWQLNAWLAEAKRAGLRIVPPEAGWQAAITAADCVVTDTGSVALYAAALDRPLLLADGDPATVLPGSPAALLAEHVRRLDVAGDLAAQLRSVGTTSPYRFVVDHAVAAPGQSAELLRTAFYELMQLPEPVGAAEFSTHPPYVDHGADVAAFVIGARLDDRKTTIVRYPATTAQHHLDFHHVAAHATRASLRQLSSAAIVFTDDATDFDAWATDTLRAWPDAELAAARGPGYCTARTRDGLTYTLTPADPTVDPLLAATLVFLRRLGPDELIAIESREVPVAIRAG